MPSAVRSPYVARVLHASSYLAMPWRNRGGESRQIAIYPSGARFLDGSFIWRLSTARTNASGPFSLFQGFKRTIVLLPGSRATLQHPGSEPITLDPLKPHNFSGDRETTCTLLTDEMRDCHIMTARKRAVHDVTVYRPGEVDQTVILDANWHFFYSAVGVFHAQIESTGTSFEVKEGDTLGLFSSEASLAQRETESVSLSSTSQDSVALGVSIYLVQRDEENQDE